MPMKTRIQEAAVDMMNLVDLDNRHRYTRKTDGKLFAGVTTVSGLLPKDWMPAWGAKEAMKALGYFDEVEGESSSPKIVAAQERLDFIKGLTVDQYLSMLKESKGAFARKRDDAAELGTEWHEFLENKIKAVIRNEDDPKAPEGNEWALESVDKFFNWCNENVKEFVLSEARVVDMENEYAGTLDCLAILKNGSPAVLDFKFSNNVSEGWMLQTAAYVRPFKPYKIDITKRFVFRFPKTEYLNEYDKKTRSYKRIKNEFEILEYPEDKVEWDFETFLHLRNAYKWINNKK